MRAGTTDGTDEELIKKVTTVSVRTMELVGQVTQ